MRKIVVEAERFLSSSNRPNASPAILMNNGKSLLGGMIYAGPETGMGSGVVEKSRNIGAKCIIVIPGSDSSSSATDAAADAMSLMNISINISRFRPNIPIVTFVTSDKHAKLLQIHRSIYPVLVASNKGSSLCHCHLNHSVSKLIAALYCRIRATCWICRRHSSRVR